MTGAAISSTEASTTTTEGAITPSVCRVFVTSQQYSGNLGGIQGGNNKCLELAGNASRAPRSGLTWKAWLSTNNYSPEDNLNKCGSYVLVDGVTQVANSWDALTDGSIYNRINQNENGDSLGDINLFDFPAVWTGTSPRGQIADDERTCDNWTRDIIEDFSNVLSLSAERLEMLNVQQENGQNGETKLAFFQLDYTVLRIHNKKTNRRAMKRRASMT
jgi:hypothetical protein